MFDQNLHDKIFRPHAKFPVTHSYWRDWISQTTFHQAMENVTHLNCQCCVKNVRYSILLHSSLKYLIHGMNTWYWSVVTFRGLIFPNNDHGHEQCCITFFHFLVLARFIQTQQMLFLSQLSIVLKIKSDDLSISTFY